MLYLSPTQSNELVVTLYENCNNKVNPYFIWQLENKETNNITTFYQDDHSGTPYYFNCFTVSFSETVGLTSGVINVSSGEYNYTVYETDTPYQLDTTGLNVAEIGLLIVASTHSQIW